MTRVGAGDNGIARTYAALVGVVLVAIGLLGFVSNPIVSSDPGATFAVNAVHSVIHIASGALALYIAFGARGETRANGLMAFGVLYAVVLVLLLLDPELFGLFAGAPANGADHVLHAALALSAIAVGYLAHGGVPRRAAT